MTKESLDTYYDDLGTTLGEALLAPTRIYVKALKSVKNAGVKVKACSHITGGGFYENMQEMFQVCDSPLQCDIYCHPCNKCFILPMHL